MPFNRGIVIFEIRVKNSERMHYVYILQSMKDDKFYTGSTNNLKRRLREHQSGNVKSTWNRRALELIYYEVYLVKPIVCGTEGGGGIRIVVALSQKGC